MKRGTVLNLKFYNKVFEFVKINNLLLCLTLFFIGGFVFGIFIFDKYTSLNDWADKFVLNFISNRTDEKFFKIVFTSFFSSMLFMLYSFIGGTSIVGVISIPLIIGVKGCLLGAVSAVLYSEYFLKGIAFQAIILMPSTIIFTIALILSAREAMRFSLIVSKLTLPTSMPKNLSFDFKNYCIKNILLSLLVLLSSVIDAVISTNFLVKFSL